MLKFRALRALMCSSVILVACGDDTTTIDAGPLPDVPVDIDRADVEGCVPQLGAIFEPLWIAGQTGTFEEVGAFGRPDAIFVDGDRLLAGDEEDGRDELHIYDLSSDDTTMRGDFLTPLGDLGFKGGPEVDGGPGELQFWGISGIAQDAASGSIFIVENRNARVQVLSRLDASPYYAYEREIGFKSLDFEMTPNGEFQTPQAARTDSMGRLYISDDAQCPCSGAARRDVQMFTPEGDFISVFGDGPREGVGTLGNLAEPENFVIDEARDRIYVCDEVPDDIAIFRYSDQTFVRRFGDLIGTPNGIDMDASGNLYVVDEGNQLTTTVRVFEPDGLTEIYNFGELSTEDDLRGGWFNSPDTLIIDVEQDLLIVADQGHDRIQGFSLSEIRAAGCIP